MAENKYKHCEGVLLQKLQTQTGDSPSGMKQSSQSTFQPYHFLHFKSFVVLIAIQTVHNGFY